MSSAQTITRNVIDDVIAVLTGAGVTAFREGIKQTATLPAISVGVVNRSVGVVAEDAGPSGFWRADVLVDCMSHVQDDTDCSTVDDSEADVMDAINVTNLITLLNAASTYCTYKAVAHGPTEPYVEGHIRHTGIVLTAYFGAITTTTTT